MIYLDSNATTQVHPEVLETMLPYLSDQYYNPSSGYQAGKKIKKSLEAAREQVATLIGASAEEIIFTSGGTEANNTALYSVASTLKNHQRIVTSQIEHSSILRTCEYLKKRGHSIEILPVTPDGRVCLNALEEVLAQGDVGLCSIMWANNETGVIQPIAEAAKIAQKYSVIFHTDAIQAVGKIPIDLSQSSIDFLSLSGHKFHAPKGIGALYVRKNRSFQPLLYGGGQEKGRRSSTENVASIIGLGKAAEIMQQKLESNAHENIGTLRDHFEARLQKEIDGVRINGSLEHRTKNTSHIALEHCEAAGLLILLDEYGIACSSGSACMTGKQQPSHVQTAMGISAKQAKSSLRISFSIFTTQEEVDTAVDLIRKAVLKLRSVQGTQGVGPVTVYT